MKRVERYVAELSLMMRGIVDQFQRIHGISALGSPELSRQEIRLLEFLKTAGIQKMKSTGEYLGVAVNSMTSIVDNLERKGFVVRKRSIDDRRVIHLELTPAGSDIAETSMQAKRKFVRSMLEVLSEDEQESLMSLFRKIARSTETPGSQQPVKPSASRQPAG